MLVYYKCNKCNKEVKKYYSKRKDIKNELECCEGGCLERQLSSPSTKTTQIIDNGIMQRKVELSNDIIEKERQVLKKRGEL